MPKAEIIATLSRQLQFTDMATSSRFFYRKAPKGVDVKDVIKF